MIRKAETKDVSRLAEIEVFSYRTNFYPIFRCDDFYFRELQVQDLIGEYLSDEAMLQHTCVYDDGVVKGFIRVEDEQIRKLFVEPILVGRHIGQHLLRFATGTLGANWLWVLEKNTKAIRFYERNEFCLTEEKKLEPGTDEILIKMKSLGD